MKVLTKFILLIMQLASKQGTTAVAQTVEATTNSLFSTTIIPNPTFTTGILMTTKTTSNDTRPITPPPPPSPPPPPPSSLFPPTNGSTVAPPTSMRPVQPTITVPTFTISSLAPPVATTMMKTHVPTTQGGKPTGSTPDINECLSPDLNKCEQICSNTPGSYVCSCEAGYALGSDGFSCQDIDECAVDNPCAQECENLPGSFICSCGEGYMLGRNGTHCQDIDECNSIYNDCTRNSECVNHVGGYTCECVTGYEKKNSSCVDEDECDDTPCRGNSECENTVGSFFCNCNDGYFEYEGSCKNIDYCELSPGCQQVCLDETTTFTCTCFKGYTLNADNKTCDRDKDNNCALDCGNGYCVSALFGDACRCGPGYEIHEDNGTISCVDINECALPTSIPIRRKCPNLCENFDGSYECSCMNGQILQPDGVSCLDIDECADDSLNNCASLMEGGTCGNLRAPFRYSCKCMEGYTGNGRSCEKIDYCLNNPCVGDFQVCESFSTSYQCNCEPDYYMDNEADCRKVGKTFSTILAMNGPKDVFIDALLDKTSEAFINMAMEIEQSLVGEFQTKYGSAFITCTVDSFKSGSIIANVATYFNAEYEGDERNVNEFLHEDAIYCDKGICNIGTVSNIDTNRTGVIDFDECSDDRVHLCLPYSTCVNDIVGSYSCDCNEGFIATYTETKLVFCEDSNECKDNPGICSSKSNSICVNTFGSYECLCEPAYTDIAGVCGSLCDIQECENGGTCIILSEGELPRAQCMCSSGYEGDKCEDRSELYKVAVGVGTTFIVFSVLLLLTVLVMACRNQYSKTYPDDDQYVDEGWDGSKDKFNDEKPKANGLGHGSNNMSGHTNVVMIAGDSDDPGPRYVTVPKESNGTSVSKVKLQSEPDPTEIQLTTYF